VVVVILFGGVWFCLVGGVLFSVGGFGWLWVVCWSGFELVL